MSIETGTPSNMLARHPETAYFWGRVIGDGDLTADCVTVRTGDEPAARRLAAHDPSVTRTEEEYTVQVFGDLAERASASLGLPIDGQPGGYRLDVFADQSRQLLRGLLEGCGTVCYKSDGGEASGQPSSGATASGGGTVGVSFVHADRRLLERVRSLLADLPVEAPTDEPAETTSGYWFGVADEAVPELGRWLYEGSESSGLFAPSRRRKLRRSLEQADP